jgi:hypothetical protein
MDRQPLAIRHMVRAIVVLLSLCMAANILLAQPTLRITAPRNGAVVNSGRAITVTVEASGTFSKVFLVGKDPIGFTKYLTAPPPGQNVYSDPVSIDVERSDAPRRYNVDPPSLTFDRLGESETLSVTGVFADGSRVDITHSTLTKYSSYKPAVATVDANGVVKAVRPGSTSILINGAISIPVTICLKPQR